MDKVTLSKEQMAAVVDFIESRGFHAPHVIVEILDHFACKVEEKLTEQPGMSLDRAMKEAHRDFGTLGFYPFLAAYEKGTKRKYRSVYWGEMKELVIHPLTIALSALSFFLIFKMYLWSSNHFYNSTFEINGMQILLLVAYIFHLRFFAVSAGKSYTKNKLFSIIASVESIPFSFFMGFSWAFNTEANSSKLAVGASLIALGFVYLGLHAIAMNRTLKIGRKENRQVLDYISSIIS